MVGIEELQSRMIFIKARLFEIAESRKEEAALRDELCNLVGEARGIMQTKAEYEKKFGMPLTPELEERVTAIIRDVRAKATIPEVPK